MIAVSFPMVFKLSVVGIIHISGVPLISKSRYRIYAPMNKNTQLAAVIPFRSFLFRKRLPVVFKFSCSNYFVNFPKILQWSHCNHPLLKGIGVFL